MKLIEIREADLELIKKIVKLEKEAFSGDGDVDLWILKALIRYGKVFIIKDGEELISIIEYMQCFDKKEVFLYGISTKKSHRRRGYSQFMLDETEKYLKELFFEKIVLTVDPNNIAAIALYKKNNYEIIEIQKDEYGSGIDRYLMEKDITK